MKFGDQDPIFSRRGLILRTGPPPPLCFLVYVFSPLPQPWKRRATHLPRDKKHSAPRAKRAASFASLLSISGRAVPATLSVSKLSSKLSSLSTSVAAPRLRLERGMPLWRATKRRWTRDWTRSLVWFTLHVDIYYSTGYTGRVGGIARVSRDFV